MSKLLGIAASIFLLFAASAASAGSWTVARSSGQAWIAAGGEWTALGAVKDLPNGATVATGKNGRIQLARGKETMMVGPGTVVTIPGDNIFGFTTIVQWAGEVAFDVEKRNVRHFEVDTPYLAAVVKGTRFIVRVGRSGASVSVSRGLVGVANSTGQRTEVLAGQAAEVSGRGDLALSGPSGVIPLQDSSLSSVGLGQGNDIDKDKSKGKDKGASSGNNSGGHGSGGNSGHGSGGNSGHGSGGNSGHGNSGSGSGGNSGHGSGGSGGGDDDDD